MHFRPMPVMSFLALSGLAVLLWLGSWQYGRYQEKLNTPLDIPESQFVILSGTVTDVPPQYAYNTHKGDGLWRVFVNVDGCAITQDEEELCDRPIFVDVALLNAVQPDLVDYTPQVKNYDAATMVLVRHQRSSMFSLSDVPEKAQWYIADGRNMARALGLADAERAILLEPEVIDVVRNGPNGEVQSAQAENPYANPAVLDDLPPARHLGYALTWYGLAATLIGVYFAFHISTRRLRFGGGRKD
jgi:surfeit locus 1 family protein